MKYFDLAYARFVFFFRLLVPVDFQDGGKKNFKISKIGGGQVGNFIKF